MPKVAFLGMGVMGAPMAGHLLTAGHTVAVWNRTRAKAGPLAAAGARVGTTPADAARGAEAVFLCVGDTPDVAAVLFGPGGAASALAPGALVVDCSTIAPSGEIEFAGKIVGAGGRYLDAPVTGGQKGAVDGTLSFMVGGDAADLERARPFFLAMGKRIFHAGSLGSGQKLKIVNQLVCAMHLVALCEAFAAAKALGLALPQAHELLTSGAAKSWALDVYGEKLLRGDYAPGFFLKWQAKDIRIARDAARDLGLTLPGMDLTLERLEAGVKAGFGDEGVQALFKLYAA